MALSFNTTRLDIFEISSDTEQQQLSNLFACVPGLLTPTVVENLPPYFHGIETQIDVQIWVERMLSESRLYAVKDTEQSAIIGFIFVFVEDDGQAHIGYLLGEEFWGKGFASELLQGFIEHIRKSEPWTKLVGGVDRKNIASSKLLLKLGFKKQPNHEREVIFYEYLLTHSDK
ncbi:N-acetyltransferase [Vibrio sp. T187]|uniref:GNAT family N-acetyltransferase n=1 Tax=Vibrio TaxID=662 RepID=UPI0010C9BE28|nr:MULTISPECIES: GNAT family N-acetyltransferase [Vibrio]MBW3698458.1 N-acetyltransferase [Vibrio sp. T187]